MSLADPAPQVLARAEMNGRAGTVTWLYWKEVSKSLILLSKTLLELLKNSNVYVVFIESGSIFGRLNFGFDLIYFSTNLISLVSYDAIQIASSWMMQS